MPSKADRERLWRLVGTEGTADQEHGGGVEVVSLFSMLLTTAADRGSVLPSAAVAAVAERYAYKASRLRVLYPQGDPFAGFTADGLEQLVKAGFLAINGDAYQSTNKVSYGTPLTVVPGKGRQRVQVTIDAPGAREMRDEIKTQQMNASSEAAKLRRDGPGMRPIDNAHVERLKESMREVGWIPTSHVLTANGGEWVIDGRHRLRAANALGVVAQEHDIKKINGEDITPAIALQLAKAANVQRAWTSADYKMWDQVYAEAGLTTDARENKRRWIRMLIEANPRRSDRDIAKEVGCSHVTVGTVRAQTPSVTSGQTSDHLSPTVTTVVTGSDGRDQVRPASKTGAPKSTTSTLQPTDGTAALGGPTPPSPPKPSPRRAEGSEPERVPEPVPDPGLPVEQGPAPVDDEPDEGPWHTVILQVTVAADANPFDVGKHLVDVLRLESGVIDVEYEVDESDG
jgi:hypothetical protein